MVSEARRQELLREHFAAQIGVEEACYKIAQPNDQQRLRRARLSLAVATICREFATGSKVLDLGCGIGLAANTLADLEYDVTAVELVPEMLEVAKREQTSPVNWVNEAFAQASLEAGSFDVVLCLGFLEYQERAGKELVRMRKLLKPGGRLILSVPNTLSPGFLFGLKRALFRLRAEPERTLVRHSFTPERLQRLLGMAGFILLDYQWLPEGREPLAKERSRELWRHRIIQRTAPEFLSLSRSYTPEDTLAKRASE